MNSHISQSHACWVCEASLLAEALFPWYLAGGRKRDLCHGQKRTLMKPPSMLMYFAKHMLLVMFTNSFLSLIKKKLSHCMCSCSTTFTRLIFVWSKFYDYSRGLFSLVFVLYSFLFTRFGLLHMNLSLLFTVSLKRTVNSELRILQNCSKYHFWGKGSVGKVTQCSFSIAPCT